ncbi:MAG: hypothetical protein IJ125_07720 [Atopobiaceae bacterium]|nr:hypothetical protein [Atopobiaceae bacterium]
MENKHNKTSMLADQCGQASTEYALTIFAFIAMLAVLALLWQAAQGGWKAEVSDHAASHSFEGQGSLSAFQDILLF